LLTFLAEIDRTLKKVTEGLEIFHETLEKLESVQNPTQKEKVEVELKKEIKKLQRLRDLIKGWQTLSEIKDKGLINDARRAIETEMERFKVLEKEMKIKAYSKEGLSQQAKLDPHELEKLKVAQWINAAVDRLCTQNDALETELESLQIAARKTKRLDGDKQERLDSLPPMIDRHKLHVRRLEQLLRLMENDKYGPDEVNAIKDDVEYYIEANQEVDFIPDDALYEQFEGLIDEETSDEDSDDDSERDSDEGQQQLTPRTSKPVESPPAPAPLSKRKSSGSLGVTPTPTPATSVTPLIVMKKTSPPPVTVTKNATPTTTTLTPTSVLSSVSMPVVLPPAPTAQHPAAIPIATTPKIMGPSFASAIAGASTSPTSIISSATSSAAAAPTTTTAAAVANMMAPKMTGKLVQTAPVGISVPGPYEELYAVIQRHQPPMMKQRTAAEVLTIIESSYLHIPDGAEMERSRTFTPKQPFTVPSYYPSNPPPILENPAIFERFELDTLFFIFYYQQKTYAQYLSARELKRQSWRFHKKYLTWFQRHEEPKTITDECEQGTYIYFDYEGNWCQRKKSEFTFEYRYLEDEETV
jgi:CCR4-NOT transcription complex subunit 3